MQSKVWYLSWLFLALLNITGSFAQEKCEIRNIIGPDGTMYYYTDPLPLYVTEQKKLLGTVVTDKENYFLTVQLFPYPSKKVAERLKDSVWITLANNKQYKLGFFNIRYSAEDSLFRIMYLINKDILQDFRTHDMNTVRINMGKEEGERTYELKLHKSAVREKLACFIKDKKKED